MLRNNADARRCSYFELGLPVLDPANFNAISDLGIKSNGIPSIGLKGQNKSASSKQVEVIN